jgi:hypothetical protein
MQDTQEKTFIFDGEELEYYPEDIDVPIIESPLDSAKYDNDDASLDEVLANLGGHFRVSNVDILNAKW